MLPVRHACCPHLATALPYTFSYPGGKGVGHQEAGAIRRRGPSKEGGHQEAGAIKRGRPSGDGGHQKSEAIRRRGPSKEAGDGVYQKREAIRRRGLSKEGGHQETGAIKRGRPSGGGDH
jgi:hypothetical protein